MNTPTRSNRPLPVPTKQQAQKRSEWAQALLSGEYRQGEGNLHTVVRTEEGYVFENCCLGVAEDIHAKGEWVLYGYDEDLTEDTPLFSHYESLSMDYHGTALYRLHLSDGTFSGAMPPSDDFEKRYGLRENDVEALAEANDSGVATFKDIAGWLTKGFIPKKFYVD